MSKAIAVIASIIIGVLLVQPASANNYGISFHRSTTYDGVESYVSIDTTAITTGWQAAPVGLTKWAIGPYVEVGFTRDCTARSNYDCKLHPYYAFEDQNGTPFVVIKTGINLGENTRYIYRVRLNDTNNEWSIIWCSGNGCQTFDQVYIGAYYLERVAVGIESRPDTRLPRQIKSEYNRYRSGSWKYYCYESFEEGGRNADISICYSDTHTWYIYGY